MTDLTKHINELTTIVEAQKLLTTIVDTWAAEGSAYAELYKVIDSQGKTVISKARMITAITVGMELGLSPQLAITMGHRLTPETVFSVLKGKELGLPLTHSLQNIITYTTKEGKVVNIIDVHAIRSILIKNSVTEEVTEDFVPDYTYYDGAGNYLPTEMVFPNGVLRDNVFIFDALSNGNDVVAATAEGKTLVEKRFEGHYKTTIKLTRKDRVVTYTYSSKEATQSGLIGSERKDTYEKFLRKMLHKQALHGAANIIAGDLIQGCLTPEQASTFISDPAITNLVDSDNGSTTEDISVEEVKD